MAASLPACDTAHHVTHAVGPSAVPNGIAPTAEKVLFDPAKHLQLEAPAYVKMLPTSAQLASGLTAGERVEFPVPVTSAPDESADRALARRAGSGAATPFTGLAYSAPFRLLSDAGVQALRSIIAANEPFAAPLPSRSAKALRGMCYRSQFMTDFNYCDEVLAHFSKIAGTPLGPHHMSMNIGQVNIGAIGSSRPVDNWHIDSVPYVCVLLLSDATDMEGGKLLVAMLGDASESIDKIRAGLVSASDIDEVKHAAGRLVLVLRRSERCGGLNGAHPSSQQPAVSSQHHCSPSCCQVALGGGSLHSLSPRQPAV